MVTVPKLSNSELYTLLSPKVSSMGPTSTQTEGLKLRAQHRICCRGCNCTQKAQQCSSPQVRAAGAFTDTRQNQEQFSVQRPVDLTTGLWRQQRRRLTIPTLMGDLVTLVSHSTTYHDRATDIRGGGQPLPRYNERWPYLVIRKQGPALLVRGAQSVLRLTSEHSSVKRKTHASCCTSQSDQKPKDGSMPSRNGSLRDASNASRVLFPNLYLFSHP
jgi:hypothetical protein